MAWRAMNSLIVLRDQANALAPYRSKASDGLVGDEDHQGTSSDHNPHYVPGVGNEIVTALDLTHDPAHGFDSYLFAETLRKHRDKRIKYVISNHRIFSSYVNGSRPAWAWGPYSGSDPHTNHVHISVLDEAISDTTTPWNLEGFKGMEQTDLLKPSVPGAPNRTLGQAWSDLSALRDWLISVAGTGSVSIPSNTRIGEMAAVPEQIKMLSAKLDLLMTKEQADMIITKLGELITAIGTIPPGNGLTEDQTVDAVKRALREGTAEQE